MDFLELAKTRYTTKKYDSSRKISEEKINELKEILRLAPSSIDSQPWKFIFISDEKLKNELAEVSYHNTNKIKDASHIVVFNMVDNVAFLEKEYIPKLALGSQDYYKNRIKPRGEEGIKIWMSRQLYIALGFFLSACAAMGIDSTPMEGIQADKYTEILKLEGYKTLFAVAIGKRAQDDENQPSITPKRRNPIGFVIEEI